MSDYDIISIIFKDSNGKEHLLTKEMQEMWKNTFDLQSIDDSFVADIPQELRQKLGKDIQIKKGSLFKIVAQGRENFIPQIREVLESPDFAIKDSQNAYLLAKHLKNEDYFVNVSVDKGGDYLISISNGIKEFNNLRNKLDKNAELLYQSPNANSNLQTLLQTSLYSANKIDEDIIPNSKEKSQVFDSNDSSALNLIKSDELSTTQRQDNKKDLSWESAVLKSKVRKQK